MTAAVAAVAAVAQLVEATITEAAWAGVAEPVEAAVAAKTQWLSLSKPKLRRRGG